MRRLQPRRGMRRAGLLLAVVAVPFAAGGAEAPGAESRPAVGVLAAAEGEVRLEHPGGGGEAVPAGAVVLEGDSLRTGDRSRAGLLLTDATLVLLGPASRIRVGRMEARGDGSVAADLELSAGLVRVLWSRAAGQGSARVETPVAIVEGAAEEAAISHDAAGGVTEVFCGSGAVRVRGKVGVLGAPLALVGGQASRVEQGQLPQAPTRVPSRRWSELRAATMLSGTGGRDGLDVGHPLLTGLPGLPPDLLLEPRRAVAPVLAGVPPFEPLPQRLSPDVRVHEQPLPEFRALLPGEPPAGRVEVEF